MKRLLIAAFVIVIAAVVGVAVWMITGSKARTVETSKLEQSFASAPAEVKASIHQALTAIQTKDFHTALASLKKVVAAGNLTEDQKAALSDTVTDITVILSENPPPNSDELFDMVADITDAIHS